MCDLTGSQMGPVQLCDMRHTPEEDVDQQLHTPDERLRDALHTQSNFLHC